MNDDDIAEIVDEFVDELNPALLDSEAERLGLTVDALLHRILTEAKARIAG